MVFKKHTLFIFLLIGAISFFSCSGSTTEGNPDSIPGTPSTETSTQNSSNNSNSELSFAITFGAETSATGLISYNEANHVFIAKAGYQSYEWWLNDSKIAGANGGFLVLTDSLISSRSLSPNKYYTVMVIVKDANGNLDSNTLEFKFSKLDD